MITTTRLQCAACLMFAAAVVLAACSQEAPSSASVAPPVAAKVSPVERGRYLVTIMACNDCHTPLKLGANGPEPDMTRLLSGHPADLKLPPAPKLPEGWGFAGSATNTAWAGPWGVSYTANLTPDKDTGLGNWTEEMFVQSMRTGKHMGASRPILPPMPWAWMGKLTDEDFKAVFAYLQSIPAISNRVPEPLAPAAK